MWSKVYRFSAILKATTTHNFTPNENPTNEQSAEMMEE